MYGVAKLRVWFALCECSGLRVATLVKIRCFIHGIKLFVLVMAEGLFQVGLRTAGVDQEGMD